MSGHKKWSTIKHKKVERCQKITIEGSVCGKPKGTCIHDYQPTLFGARRQV